MTDAAKEELREIVRLIGPGFHPDTDCHDYIKPDNSKLFDWQTAKRLNRQISKLFTRLPDIYQSSLDIFAEEFNMK